MLYQKDCPKCKGVGFQEFEAGLIQVECSECNGTGKVQQPIPLTKPGQYFCVLCESAHKEDSKLGKRHLQYKAEVPTIGEIMRQPGDYIPPEEVEAIELPKELEEALNDNPDIGGAGPDNQPAGSGDTSEPE